MKKKMIVFVMCLTLLALSACGSAAKTEASELPSVAELSAANRLSVLMENNECVIYSQIDMISGGVCHTAYYKGADGKNCVINEWNGYSSYGNDEMSLMLYGSDVSMSISAMKDSILISEDDSFFPDDGEPESLSLDENGDYICRYKTEMDEETAAGYEEMWPCKAGDFMVSETVVDAQTLLVQRIDFYLEYAETGKTEYIAIGIIRFGQQPEMPYALERLLNGETHTVTLTLSDGNVRSYTVPTEATVDCYAEDEEQLYEDEAGTVPYEFPNSPLDDDISLYSR